MSQCAAKRLRKRFKIKFRDVARLGRPVYAAGPGTQEAAAKREQRWRENFKKGLTK